MRKGIESGLTLQEVLFFYLKLKRGKILGSNYLSPGFCYRQRGDSYVSYIVNEVPVILVGGDKKLIMALS